MNNEYSSPVVAFFLSFFPGGGQFYYQRLFAGVFYFMATVLPAVTAIALVVLFGYFDFFMFLILLIGVFFYMVSFIDTLITSRKRSKELKQRKLEGSDGETTQHSSEEYERFFTIVLSFIPGVGHFQLGLMNRGFTFLTAFIGAGIMIVFIAIFLRQDVFLIFMAFLPVVWVYSFFDAVQQLNKKQRGEELQDSSVLEELENRHKDGHKSKTIATILSIFPGAGHLYLGLQKRGIQLMAAFLLSMYILDVLRLGIFMFLIPIIWFYSFFDGLQMASRHGKENLEDKPLITYLFNHQRWIGIGFIALGAFFILDRVFVPSIAPRLTEFFQADVYSWYYNHFQVLVVSILLIGGGVKLIAGSKKKVGASS
ncbi:hypothetical protein ACERII_20610 [Evansella sp. AB-rgal1]|uniref:hypothetical protein n=1 Tax=Evansella sp. AB-rgal1 TaxID=3242696 RepID=UPI00359D18CC